jgi:protein SCO1/2
MPTPPPSPPSVYRWLIGVLGIVLVLVVLYRLSSDEPTPQGQNPNQLPVMGTVPAFMLTERSGKNVSNRDLEGKIYVADFVYTMCPGPCPLVSANMAKVQKATANDPHVQLVTFTVDPQNDTPAVLAAYADKLGADPNRWWFLTGPEKPLYQLIQDGFYQTVEDNRGKAPQDGQFTVTHSLNFALVDAQGRLRGNYKAVGDDNEIEKMYKDITALENEEALHTETKQTP